MWQRSVAALEFPDAVAPEGLCSSTVRAKSKKKSDLRKTLRLNAQSHGTCSTFRPNQVLFLTVKLSSGNKSPSCGSTTLEGTLRESKETCKRGETANNWC